MFYIRTILTALFSLSYDKTISVKTTIIFQILLGILLVQLVWIDLHLSHNRELFYETKVISFINKFLIDSYIQLNLKVSHIKLYLNRQLF
jgi:hypothetical protein